MCQEAGIFSAGRVLYSVPRVTSLDDHIDRQDDPNTIRLGRSQDPPGVLHPIRFGQALAHGLALGQQEGVSHPAP